MSETATCDFCGVAYEKGQIIVLNKRTICAQCKPKVLGRLMAGSHQTSDPSLDIQPYRLMNKVVMSASPTAPALPERCFKCNEPSTKYLKYHFRWMHPLFYLLLLVNVIVTLIVFYIVSKKANVSIPLCERHKTHRTVAIILTWLFSLLIPVLIITGASMESGLIAALALPCLIAAIVCGYGFARTARPCFIDNNIVHIKGAGKAFLDSLPMQ